MQLVTLKIDRKTGKQKEVSKKVKGISKDDIYKPLAEILGDAFLEQYKR